jgi:hypothetical protein
MMKSIFEVEAAPKGGRSETSPTTSGLQNITGRNFHGSPASTGCGWSAQLSRIPARGHQESVLMMSQLG